jgi:CheY-like chemotaxis protein
MSNPFALIVEDDDDAAIVFNAALRAGGFTTEIVRDGATALACLADMTPDVVVLDLHLPHISGEDILRRIRTDERLVDTRVIIASAYPHNAELIEADLREAGLRGPDLVLIKPISFSHLRDLSKRLVSPPYPPGQEEVSS